MPEDPAILLLDYKKMDPFSYFSCGGCKKSSLSHSVKCQELKNTSRQCLYLFIFQKNIY